MEARQKGKNWGPIAFEFPGKTPNACRKRHERLMVHHNNTGDWDSTRMESLAKAYYEVRQEMWAVLADRMGGQKWDVVEAKVGSEKAQATSTDGADELPVHGKRPEDSLVGRQNGDQT